MPERNSCTKYGVFPSIPKSKINVMFGCCSAPASWASRKKRCVTSVSVALQVFSATQRWMKGSHAL